MSSADFPLLFKGRVKELLKERNMTVQQLADKTKLSPSIINRILKKDLFITEKEYINAIIIGFGLTYEEFFIPTKSKKQAQETINKLPKRLINFLGDDDNFVYIDLAAYFKACGYTSAVNIAKIVDHWYDLISDDYVLKYHPKRKNPIRVPFDHNKLKSFIGETGERPVSYLDWLAQYI